MARQGVAFLAATAGSAGVWVAAAFVLAMALVLTGSRGGILASIAELAFALLVLMRGRRARAGLGVFVALVTVGIAIFTFGDFFAARLLQLGFDATDRLAVYLFINCCRVNSGCALDRVRLRHIQHGFLDVPGSKRQPGGDVGQGA